MSDCRAYGAALVVGTIDEDPVQAQAFTRERKLAVAQRSVDLLTNKYGIPAEDLIIDPLVFPCATGDENYIGGAVETIEALRLIKHQIAHVKTVLVFPIPFDCLQPPAKSSPVFLYYCTVPVWTSPSSTRRSWSALFPSLPTSELCRELANTPPADNALFAGASQDWREQPQEQSRDQPVPHCRNRRSFSRTHREQRHGCPRTFDQRLANGIIAVPKTGSLPILI
ncbi:MAG: dihydropteroate synthase [Bryobacteraceae bacterium]